jgi:uncharacterized protein YegP (UPF0339 family)
LVDESFSAHGLLRSPLTASGKSQAPDSRAPINLAFRLRQILGHGARAEVVRVLLTSDARASGAVVARSAGYARPNVYEALGVLHKAGVVSVAAVGADQHYGLDRQRWAVLLEEPPDWAPVARHWPQLLGGLRVAEVEVGAPSRRRAMVTQIYEDAHGDYRWRIQAANGQIVGEGAEAYSSRRNAIDAARTIAAGQRGSHIDVDQDQHGHWRWTMRASGGEVVARSSDGFASRYNAERAARRLQAAATEATPSARVP